MVRALLFSLVAAAAVLAHSDTGHTAQPYGLDDTSRTIAARGRVVCPELEMVKHRGDAVRYHKPVRVYVEFRDRLRAFERIAAEVGVEVYGRAPRRIHHLGTFNCRRIRSFPDLLSEHGLGNAIDVEAFEFGPATRAEREAAPRGLRGAFTVSIERHWDGDRGAAALHARFLHRLTERLIEEDVFRVMLGPAFPGHRDHFHFDMAPYRLIEL